MSGFEIAGITLAALDQAFKVASALKEVISDERHFGKDATKWRLRMDDEQLRLRTLQQLLFDELPSALGSSKRMFDEFEPEWQLSILEMLRQLRRLLTKYIPMQILYELTRPLSVLDPSLAMAPELAMEFVEGPVLEKKLQSSTSIWLKWRWSLSQKKDAEKLVAEFNEWNNRIKQNMELILLRVQLFRTVPGLEILQTDPKARTLGLSRTAKLKNIVLNQHGIVDKQTNKDEVPLRNEKLSDFVTGVWKKTNKKVLVEYQKYSPVDGQAAASDVASINELVALLDETHHAEFNTLRCDGFFDDKENNQFGLFFEIPRGVDAASAYSLQHAFTSKVPTINQRFQLCYILSQALSSFHVVGWLHKSLRSSVVLFFDEPESGKNLPVPLTPVIAGFEYSRPDAKITSGEYDDIFERNLYRHPLRQGRPQTSFKRIHDIYALGVVLLEIGVWKPAMSMMGSLSGGGKPNDIYSRLLWLAKNNLPMKMGDRFLEVTLKCLDGQFGVEVDDENETELQKAFCEDVVEVLGAAVASL